LGVRPDKVCVGCLLFAESISAEHIVQIMSHHITTAAKQLSFRAKKLDFSKSLPVYHIDDLSEFADHNQVSRIMPTIATGVEKEEEEEHHLQAAISAAHVAGHSAPLYIPTPDASKEVQDYNELYPENFKMPKSLIRVTETLEQMTPMTYDMNEENEAWLMQYNATAMRKITEEQFEMFIDQLEKLTKTKGNDELATLQDIEGALNSGPYIESGQAFYEYWSNMRKIHKSGLTPTIRVSFDRHFFFGCNTPWRIYSSLSLYKYMCSFIAF
jgi:enhancer of polycomb-like protein